MTSPILSRALCVCWGGGVHVLWWPAISPAFCAYLPWTVALTCGTVIHTAPMRTVMSSWAVRIPYTLRRKPSVFTNSMSLLKSSPPATPHSLSLRATSACHTDTETPDFFPELPVERGPSNTDSRSIPSFLPMTFSCWQSTFVNRWISKTAALNSNYSTPECDGLGALHQADQECEDR